MIDKNIVLQIFVSILFVIINLWVMKVWVMVLSAILLLVFSYFNGRLSEENIMIDIGDLR